MRARSRIAMCCCPRNREYHSLNDTHCKVVYSQQRKVKYRTMPLRALKVGLVDGLSSRSFIEAQTGLAPMAPSAQHGTVWVG